MSNNTKVIKELSKLTGKDFRVFDSKFLDNNRENSDYMYSVQGEDIIFIGLDLMKLNLEDKVLEDIEKSLSNLKNLKGLSIEYNKNNEVPGFIRNFNNLETLNLQKNNLKSLPDWMKEFKNLKYLNLEFNNLQILPEWLGTLTNLETLKLEKNTLEWNEINLEILKSICERNGNITATRLLSLQAYHNFPTEQIEIIRELEKENTEKEKLGQKVNRINIKVEEGRVVEWRLFEYNIISLPENFGVFNHLRSMIISRSKIETLPESFGELKDLETLDLSNNKLISLPESFVNLTAIKNLNLNNNQLTEIPTQLWALKELTKLNLSNNPFNPEDATISQKVPDLIRKHLRKKATIRVFISHAVVDFEPYHIKDLVDYLVAQKDISQVFFCEEDLAGNIDEWMLDALQKCHLILFIGTQKSVFNSPDCANELQLADKFSIPVIPLKGQDINWPDLAEINLSRELGLEYDKENFNEFFEKLYKYILNFKQEIDLMDKVSRQRGITDIYERFRLMLDETINDMKRKMDDLAKRIAKLEEKSN